MAKQDQYDTRITIRVERGTWIDNEPIYATVAETTIPLVTGMSEEKIRDLVVDLSNKAAAADKSHLRPV